MEQLLEALLHPEVLSLQRQPFLAGGLGQDGRIDSVLVLKEPTRPSDSEVTAIK